MNNYSAESSTEEVMKFLAQVLKKATEYLDVKEVEHHVFFCGAKDYTAERLDDTDNLLLCLDETGHNTNDWYWESDYQEWLDRSWFDKLFIVEPIDDRADVRATQEAKTILEAQERVLSMLDNMDTMSNFYSIKEAMNNERMTTAMHTKLYYPVGYELTVLFMDTKLPKTMWQEHIALTNYSKDIAEINRMVESLAVYEFDTVTIEEDMLQTIESVQRIAGEKKS